MTSVGEGEVDGNPLHIHTLSSQINSPTSSSSSSFSDESTTDSGGEREEEYHNQIIYESIPAVGGFREGKPFHIFNFLSQTETPSSSSSGDGDDFPPLYVCPSFRKSKEWRDLSPKNPNRSDFLPVDVFPYPYLYNRRSGDQQFRFLIGSDIYHHTCKLPLVPLFWCNNEECMPNYREFCCGLCQSSKLSTDYYFCVACSRKFHKECIEFPLEIQHPSYPFLSLKLHHPSDKSVGKWPCFCCQEIIFLKLYYCPTNKLIMHPLCAMKPIPIVIDHPKRHLHPLTFFPKQKSLACDVCGLIKEHFPTYVCARCVFVVHKDCIYHPYVIRISRHHHRISFNSSLPSGKWSCGVCRRKVDNSYGAYSCNKCDGYFVHTNCALRKDLWDGKELEGVPEELEIVVEPFERISDGVILHFAHEHHLRFEISGANYDEEKSCQACILPIYEGSYYSCMEQCDFILHARSVCQRASQETTCNACSLTYTKG